MTDNEHEAASGHEAAQSLAEASRAASVELHKQGTAEYDARAHQRAVEFERKAADAVAVRSADHANGPSDS